MILSKTMLQRSLCSFDYLFFRINSIGCMDYDKLVLNIKGKFSVYEKNYFLLKI